GSKRARIIGKATRLDMVITSQMNCKKELDKAGRGADEAISALVTVEAGLEDIPDYESLEGSLNEVEDSLNTIEKSILRAEKIQKLAAHSRKPRLGSRPNSASSNTIGWPVSILETCGQRPSWSGWSPSCAPRLTWR
ncbi:hypothetical protein LCGC14_2481380, partial [marine sediment metagenome]